MTERDFAEDLVRLLTCGLIEFDETAESYDESPRLRPTVAGLAEIAEPNDVERTEAAHAVRHLLD